MKEVKLDENQFKLLRSDMDSIKKLLVLLLKNSDIKGNMIAKAMGISQGRLSQIFPQKKYKKSKKES